MCASLDNGGNSLGGVGSRGEWREEWQAVERSTKKQSKNEPKGETKKNLRNALTGRMLSKFINPAPRTVVVDHFGPQIGREKGQGLDGSRSTFWLGALTSNCICSCCGFVGARWRAEGAGRALATAARDAKLRQGKAKAAPLTVRQAGEKRGKQKREEGRSGWHSLVVSASKN